MAIATVSSKFVNSSILTVSQIWKGFYQMATDSKQACLVSTIGTHSGVFHCDEVLACFMLRQLQEYANAKIIRTRDEQVLNTCDIVVDVGSVYNPMKHKYDHHQRDFSETLSSVRPDLAKNRNIKLSSAGLIYAHFGMEVLSQILIRNNCNFSTISLAAIYLYVYDGFVQEIDAIDNGTPMCVEGQPYYQINTSLSVRVQRLNPSWNSKTTKSQDVLFEEAIDYVGAEFTSKVMQAGTEWWPAREIVMEALLNRNKVYTTGEIIEIENYCPWVEHLFSLEEELKIDERIKFVLFSDKDGSYRVQSVPITPGSFVCRNFLHQDWRGLRGEDLIQVSGIDGAIFCHHTGFIGGNKTREGAFQMAVKSLHVRY
ncbi:hypothetical protein FQA39_LY08013 [Lamprigera yunnana]|nr:hypothetical protein FQA39_LY08013 [Lamprigera yunnana]